MNNPKDNREQMLRRIIGQCALRGHDFVSGYVDISDSYTGELYEEEIPVDKTKLENTPVKGSCAKPYMLMTSNKEVQSKFLDPLGNADFRRVYNMMSSIDSFGRLKYGEHLNQYCRSFEDIGKVVGLSGKPLQKFIKIIREAQIIRIVSIDKCLLGTAHYITFNPAIAINGVFYDRFTTFAWRDMIAEYDLLPIKSIRKIMKDMSPEERDEIRKLDLD